MNPFFLVSIQSQHCKNNVLELLILEITLWLSLMECDKLGCNNKIILILRNNRSIILWVFNLNSPKDSIYYDTVMLY